MQRNLVIILVLIVLIVIFALQNSTIVNLKLWFWDADIHLGLILILTFVLGALIGVLFSIPMIMRKNKQISRQSEIITGIKQTEEEENAEQVGEGDPEFEDIQN